MQKNMINKTVRFSEEDWARIKVILSMDPKCENHSQAIYYAYQYVNNNLDKINFIQSAKAKSCTTMIEVSPSEYSAAKSFSVEEDVFENVLKEFKHQFQISKVRISFMTRIVLTAYELHLNNMSVPEKRVKIDTTTLDALKLLQQANNKAAELIESGQISKVLAFIEDL